MSRATRYADLERAIDAVVDSYADDGPINNLKSAALPNERRCIEALLHIQPALLMGFYSARGLNRDNLRFGLAEHLHRAHELLVEQIDRALSYNFHDNGRGDKPAAGAGEEVVLELFESLPELRRQLDGDVHAAFDRDVSANSIEEVVFSYPSIKAMTAYRVARRLWLAQVPMIPRILTEYAHRVAGIDIHPGAQIGERFFVDHGTGVVVGETSVIGDDVKLYQGVTLGALSIPRRGSRDKRHPTLEDDVTVYANANILGGDTVVGRGSIVGANVWLTESVPPGSRIF